MHGHHTVAWIFDLGQLRPIRLERSDQQNTGLAYVAYWCVYEILFSDMTVFDRFARVSRTSEKSTTYT